MSVQAKLPIDDVVALALCVAHLGNAAGEAYEDGSFGIGDIDDVFHAASAVKDMLKLDFKGKVLPQLKDMDATELKKVVDAFDAEFDIPEDQLEASVKSALALGGRLFDVVKEAIDWARGPAAPAPKA